MEQRRFAEIVERAKGDPEFLHRLVFEPETLVAELKDGLTRAEIGAVVGKSPAEVVARTIGVDSYCGNTCTSSCDNTCGGSCGYTTNLTDDVMPVVSYFSRLKDELGACGNTCTSSCDNTCGQSCGFTTNLTDLGSFVSRPQSFR